MPAEHATLPYACSLCGSCTDVCPVKIDLHQQLFTWRNKMVLKGLLPASKRWGMKLTGAVLRRPWLYRLSGRMMRFSLRWLPRWVVYNHFNVWGRQRDLPPAPSRSFRELYHQRRSS